MTNKEKKKDTEAELKEINREYAKAVAEHKRIKAEYAAELAILAGKPMYTTLIGMRDTELLANRQKMEDLQLRYASIMLNMPRPKPKIEIVGVSDGMEGNE